VYATAAAARGKAAMQCFDGLDGYEALLVDPAGLRRTTCGWPAA
jgi:hypothetical protein